MNKNEVEFFKYQSVGDDFILVDNRDGRSALHESSFIGGSLESPLWLFMAFCPQILVGFGNLQMVHCHSMNAGSMVGTT